MMSDHHSLALCWRPGHELMGQFRLDNMHQPQCELRDLDLADLQTASAVVARN